MALSPNNYVEPPLPPLVRNGYGGREWPTTSEGIRDERGRRLGASLGLGYSGAEIKRLNLFKALDANGDLIAETRRVLPLIRFVVSVDASAIWTSGLSWRVASTRMGPDVDPVTVDALASFGSDVWDHSKMDEVGPSVAWNLCAMGDWCLEVVNTSTGPVIVSHDPRRVRVEWDALGLSITRAVVDVEYHDPPAPNADTGEYEGEGQPHKYRRILTPTEVSVYLDGRKVEAESGPNVLGVVPMVWLRFRRVGEFELSSWAGDGAEDAVAMIDSMLTQIQVVGGRHANPILVAIGAQIQNGAELTQVGRTASLPAGADLAWLEAALQGVRELGAAAASLYEQVTQAYPEFLFVDAGASSSGTALSYRAGAFSAKIAPVRASFYRGLSTALGMAVAMSQGEPWTPAADLYEVDGGSALPMDVGAVAQMLRELVADGLMLPADAVARLQSEGVVPDDLEPVEYVAQAMLAAQDREAGVIRSAAALAAEVDRMTRDGEVGDAVDAP